MADLTAQLRALWMQRTFAGASEKFDNEVAFDLWLATVKAEAWAEGLKVGWEATSDRTHYDMPTGYRDLPRYLKKRNPYGRAT